MRGRHRTDEIHFTGVLSLNSASVAISRYLTTSRQFVAKVETLDKAGGSENALGISETARFADERLLRDMNDARIKLAAAAEISSSTLSFLESLNHYIGCSDADWNKTKLSLAGLKQTKGQDYVSQYPEPKNRTQF
jgi:hypothetical protein